MPAKKSTRARNGAASSQQLLSLSSNVAFLTSTRIRMGPIRDPKPVYSSGEAPICFKRIITKTSSNIQEAILTFGDLFNMFGGAAFTYKVIKISCWVLNPNVTAQFQFKRLFTPTQKMILMSHAVMSVTDGTFLPSPSKCPQL